MFKKLIRERRCLIPANCHYEWKEMPVGKRPYCLPMKDESPFQRALFVPDGPQSSSRKSPLR